MGPLLLRLTQAFCEAERVRRAPVPPTRIPGI